MADQQPDDGAPWEAMLREMLGPAADEAIAQLRASGMDPAAMAAAQGMTLDPASMRAAFEHLKQLMAAGGDDPVNLPMAHELARHTAAAGGDPSVGEASARATVEALTVADLWLDAVTDLDPAPGRRRALSRAEWVEATLPAFRVLTEPVAASLTAALSGLLDEQLRDGALPEGVTVPPDLVHRLGSTVFGLQVGQAVGTLAREVFGLTDVGVPLSDTAGPALLPADVAAFAEGLDAPVEEVRLFLAVREAAAARLFAGVPWLRGWLHGAVEAYARGITIDADQLEDAFREIDLSDPQAMQAALVGGVFAPQTTPAQQAALTRLETALALVEGWVDEVSAAAVAAHLPHAVPLREMVRRRRASGGPAEHTFATLVGLELRPRRAREAATLFATLAAESGTAGRDGVWAHPDLIPRSADLDDPAGYLARRRGEDAEQADLDQALADILGTADAGYQSPPAPGATERAGGQTTGGDALSDTWGDSTRDSSDATGGTSGSSGDSPSTSDDQPGSPA